MFIEHLEEDRGIELTPGDVPIGQGDFLLVGPKNALKWTPKWLKIIFIKISTPETTMDNQKILTLLISPLLADS